ncbi:LLM class flavin-dependent oxidoreductase [Pseudonocardia endophytica]|uniref:Alkanesulfonate monooxygenase SsuD/methylene tetrahydromethanopterin reductase-like flavin-dependent oxidoreductase (Luciferase family) n=1 Tax=Pseudonocardia endophytica TaxID=401976 RepID=A0A4R1HUK4_PSEEN|nr:LLM class flavin-dependent oxidoreductase [Pseudonocardia endophytica]TCK26384.1 alkanesulfonate monooxygenase SsuD/methylene tetrahydromethanopterin reductase-like flavin-dependent oxidoreductase (luciferase family) [Pseudonocardia endophytica]
MSVGVLFTQGTVSGDPHIVLSEMLEQAEAADRLGFCAALTTEHTRSPEYFGSALPLAFAIAARTERVRVGTAIAIGPLYNPVRLAQDAAMLDQLSGGRAWLGLGAGYTPEDFACVGVGFDDRAQRFDEVVRIVRAAHTRETFTFHGDLHTLDDVAVQPRPVAPEGVPLHLGAWTPGGLRRAGRLGDGWITNALMALPTIAAAGETYRAAARAAGRTPHVTAIRFCWPYTSRDEALSHFGDTALAMARTLFDYGAIVDLPGVTSSDEITLDAFVADRFVFGTPDECVETLRRFRDDAGVDDFLTIFRYPTGPDQASVLEAMDLFGREVLPAL